MRRLLVNIEQPRQVHRSVHRKNLPGFQFEVGAQALDDFRIGVGFNLKAHRISLAPVVQFSPYRLQQIAGLFLRQIKIAVAGHTKSCGRNDVVPVIHP